MDLWEIGSIKDTSMIPSTGGSLMASWKTGNEVLISFKWSLMPRCLVRHPPETEFSPFQTHPLCDSGVRVRTN